MIKSRTKQNKFKERAAIQFKEQTITPKKAMRCLFMSSGRIEPPTPL
jgi:hypothetical protein